MITIDEALKQAVIALEGGESPSVDAKVLLCHVLDKTQTYLFTWPDNILTASELSAYQALIERRKQGYPVAYLTGTRDFWSLTLATSKHTLIPRPDTEVLVEQVLANMSQFSGSSPLSICDLGTGTGAIALALASELPDARITGVDLIPEAVSLAKENASRNNISHVVFKQSSWFDALEGQRFHIIASNPPYIESSSPFLHQGDVRFEPSSALTSGDDGLDDIRHIIQQSPRYLHEGGLLAFEHGFNQGDAIRALFSQRGFVNIETHQDYSQLDRVTVGYWQTCE